MKKSKENKSPEMLNDEKRKKRLVVDTGTTKENRKYRNGWPGGNEW